MASVITTINTILQIIIVLVKLAKFGLKWRAAKPKSDEEKANEACMCPDAYNLPPVSIFADSPWQAQRWGTSETNLGDSGVS